MKYRREYVCVRMNECCFNMGLPTKSWNNADKTAHLDLPPIRLKCNYDRKFLLDINCCYQ